MTDNGKFTEIRGVRQIYIRNHGETYLFRYRLGQEADIISEIKRTAEDPNYKFDLFDAAVLSHEIGMQTLKEIEKGEERK